VTETRLEHSRLFALAGAGDRSSVLIPKLHLHKGLPLGFDVSAFIGGAITAALCINARVHRGKRPFYAAPLLFVVGITAFVAGFLVTTIPPFLVWAIGYHWMKINPAVLMGGVAGARSHSGPAREAAKEIGSSVPWIGFPVAYAISGVLLTVFGYLAMVLSK
jgi:hypothetical protein